MLNPMSNDEQEQHAAPAENALNEGVLIIALFFTTFLLASISAAFALLKKRFARGEGGTPQPRRSIPMPTTIGALGAELLLRVFYALPWRDRVRGVEGVCRHWHRLMHAHGWDDVRHFNEKRNEFYKLQLEQQQQQYTDDADRDRFPWKGPLLTRIGPRLVGLHLRGPNYNKSPEECHELLRADLAKCPAVRHLRLSRKRMELASPTLAYIVSRYGSTLKSLKLEHCSPLVIRRLKVYDRALSNALATFTALEYLSVYELGYPLSGLRFPDSALSLTNLRRLEFNCRLEDGPTGVFNEANVRVLASLPMLSSLVLEHPHSTASYSFLRHFTRLQHLAVVLCSHASVGGFVEAMPNLAVNLRALVVSLWGPDIGSVLPQLVPAIATHLTELEHLTLYSEWVKGGLGGEAVLKCLQPLSSSYFTLRLRSLEIFFHEARTAVARGGSWGWLEGMRQLEYLALSEAPPLATICAVIKECKRLHYLTPDSNDYNPTAEEQAQLVTAAAGAGGADEEQGAAGLSPTPLPLHVTVKKGATIDSAACTGSRLRFTKHSVSSPVEFHYAFGCLSEPPLDW